MEQVFLSKAGISKQYENLTKMLHKVLEQQSDIIHSIGDLKVLRDTLVRDIKLDNITLEMVLEVSDSTLYRWRKAPAPYNLPYYMRENGTIYYDFDEVLGALRKGQLNARGFNRLHAIERMITYREDILQAKGGGSWLIADK